jgi:Zn-dependent protease with chaperone function
MNYTDYTTRILRIEQASAKQQRSGRIWFWLALGYGYPVLVALLALALPVIAAVALLRGRVLVAIALFVAWLSVVAHIHAVVQSFRISFADEEDDRVEIKRSDAPLLFDAIDTLIQQAPHITIDQVFVDNNTNASVRQIPRWGYLRGSRNIVTLGLPYLLTMSRAQLLAVLAHEFGHLVGEDGKLTRRVYMLVVALNRFRHQLSKNGNRSGLLSWAIAWYLPRLEAETMVVRRANEYTADRFSARALKHAGVDEGDACDALIVSYLTGRWLADSFWPAVFAQAGQSGANNRVPHFKPWLHLSGEFANAAQSSTVDLNWGHATASDATSEAQVAEHSAIPTWQYALCDQRSRTELTLWLAEYLAQLTDYEDSHPALYDRMRAMRPDFADFARGIVLPAAPKQSAATTLLGESAQRLCEHFSVLWQKAVAAYWESLHERGENDLTQEYHRLLRKKASQALSAQDWLAIAQAQQRLRHTYLEVDRSIEQCLAAEQNPIGSLGQSDTDAVERMRQRAYLLEELVQLVLQRTDENIESQQSQQSLLARLNAALEECLAIQNDHFVRCSYYRAIAAIASLAADTRSTDAPGPHRPNAQQAFIAFTKLLQQRHREQQTRYSLIGPPALVTPTLTDYEWSQLKEAVEPMRAHSKAIYVAQKSMAGDDQNTLLVAVHCRASLANWLGLSTGLHFRQCQDYFAQTRLPLRMGHITHCVESGADAAFKAARAMGRLI